MAKLGSILEIDLTEKKWFLSPFPDDLVPKYICGRGFNAWRLFHDLVPGTDPLGPENVLILSCGLLTGTTAPASSRLHVNALSPLTGLLGSSNVGGDFGAALRAAGIQSLIVRGRASGPVYIQIEGAGIRIRDARTLWGLDTWETRERLKRDTGDRTLKTMAIGPAGENGALFACMIVDGEHAAGRTGMGAVMASKRLKAVVITGRGQKICPPSPAGREAVRRYAGRIRASSHFDTLSRYGGAGYVQWADDMGILASYNYRRNRFPEVAALDVRGLDRSKTRSRGCHRCPVRCKAELRFQKGRFREGRGLRPEFESMVSLGSKCGLSDLETLIYLDNLCSRLGLDSISAGSAVAFAMDLYDRGILTNRDTGGADLRWGNGEAMEDLILQMARGEGLGAILSQGVRRASRQIGRGSDRFAFHVKGLELAAYHPGHLLGTALGYAVSNRGGDFNDVYASLEYGWSPERAAEQFGTPLAVDRRTTQGKALLVRRAMLVTVILDSLGLCKIPALSLIGDFDLTREADLTASLTGCPVDGESLLGIGERIVTLERLINLRHGATPSDDRLPGRLVEGEPRGEDPSRGTDWLTPMVLDFYGAMGWDRLGRPEKERIEALGLGGDLVEAAVFKKAS